MTGSLLMWKPVVPVGSIVSHSTKVFKARYQEETNLIVWPAGCWVQGPTLNQVHREYVFLFLGSGVPLWPRDQALVSHSILQSALAKIPLVSYFICLDLIIPKNNLQCKILQCWIPQLSKWNMLRGFLGSKTEGEKPKAKVRLKFRSILQIQKVTAHKKLLFSWDSIRCWKRQCKFQTLLQLSWRKCEMPSGIT